MMKLFKYKLVGILLIIFLSASVYAAGAAAGDSIEAPSINLEIVYSSTGGSATTTENGSDFSIPDFVTSVTTINGILETTADVDAFSSLTYDSGVYKGAVPGTEYILYFTYLNRGNEEDDVLLSANITQEGSAWTGDVVTTAPLAEDSIHTFIVTLNPATVYNLERATLNILAQIVTPDNVVSYNAFADATIAYSGPVGYSGYGGIDNIPHQYVIEAEGYSLAFISRNATVIAPPDYKGGGQPDVVPGAKIRYDIVIKNNSGAIAGDIEVIDVIPANCHLYYTETPAVVGDAGYSGEWKGAINNDADSSTPGAVKFLITIPASGTVTASYSVTID